MAIVINIGELLAKNRMHSKELAEKLGFTVQTVSRLKNGKVHGLRLDVLDKLCKLFDCQVGDIVEYVEDEEARARFGEGFWEVWQEYGLDETPDSFSDRC